MVLAGAAAGGLARYVISAAVMQRVAGRFPLGTLVVNVTGCFLIGVLMSLFIERGAPHPNLRLLLVTGVLGGYTTFSAFAWEILRRSKKAASGSACESRGQRCSGIPGGVVRRVAGSPLNRVALMLAKVRPKSHHLFERRHARASWAAL
jgi:CrcB protein